MMQSSLVVRVVIGKVLTLQVHWADEERSEGGKPEGNVPRLLRDRFAKGEREKMVTQWDSPRMYGVTNVQSYQVTKACISRLSHAKVPKIDNASVLNRNM